MDERRRKQRSPNGLSRKKLFVISGIPFVTWTRNVKKGGERNGGGWKAAGSADGATKLLKILVDLEQPDLSCVSSTRSSSTLSLVYSCVPSHFPSRPFIIEHRVIRHVSHGPLFFQSCRFLLSPLGPFRTTAGDQSRERERELISHLRRHFSSSR